MPFKIDLEFLFEILYQFFGIKGDNIFYRAGLREVVFYQGKVGIKRNFTIRKGIEGFNGIFGINASW